MSNVTFDMKTNSMEVHEQKAEPWRVTLVDTGDDTATGGRLKRVSRYLEGEQRFCFTYGDGLCDIDIGRLLDFHVAHGRRATVTAVYPPGRFGSLESENNIVRRFNEKPRGDGGRINGGFFVLDSNVLSLIDGDDMSWESKPLETLASQGQLMAYEHDGFWQPMDTLRDKMYLEELWVSGGAPWKVWK